MVTQGNRLKDDESLAPHSVLEPVPTQVIIEGVEPTMTIVGTEEKHKEINIETSVSRLEHLSWRNWLLVVGVLIVTTVGLITALPPLLSVRVTSPWPWAKTDLALLVTYSLVILALAGYLTQQHRKVIIMRRRLHSFGDDAYEHIKRNSTRLYGLLNVSHIMSAEMNLQNVFDHITKVCVETFVCNQASLMLFDKAAQELRVRSACGHLDMSYVLDSRRKIGDGIAGWGGLTQTGAPSKPRL